MSLILQVGRLPFSSSSLVSYNLTQQLVMSSKSSSSVMAMRFYNSLSSSSSSTTPPPSSSASATPSPSKGSKEERNKAKKESKEKGKEKEKEKEKGKKSGKAATTKKSNEPQAELFTKKGWFDPLQGGAKKLNTGVWTPPRLPIPLKSSVFTASPKDFVADLKKSHLNVNTTSKAAQLYPVHKRTVYEVLANPTAPNPQRVIIEKVLNK